MYRRHRRHHHRHHRLPHPWLRTFGFRSGGTQAGTMDPSVAAALAAAPAPTEAPPPPPPPVALPTTMTANASSYQVNEKSGLTVIKGVGDLKGQ